MTEFQSLLGQMLAPKYIGWLLDGLSMTLYVSAVVSVLSTLLGIVIAAARSSHRRWLSLQAATFLSLFRNTPLLVQLFFWYFGVSSLLPEGAGAWLNTVHDVALGPYLRLTWPSFELLCAVLGLSLYSAAYISEEIRAGMRGVAEAQRLAGAALGFSSWQVLRYVILPQATRIALPPLLGQYMNIIKNTSLSMAIGLAELSYTSRQVEAQTFKTFQAFGVATLFYIAAIALLETIGQLIQRRHKLISGGQR
ncbi:Glutamate Aspartate transport system permease protein GltJ [Collimonas arenae]|uniref:Glutamate Aspartate transport system permease protein GltJ n=1 Tax=Collimonas arenae TaxID=279058 RepID=A0A0A1FBT2_9BURK|nr:amino acid ABC transporter permease [Collimonas arenae]AIY41139.1 Glutamate Aspartate transport system permease protein GltJ [Collimonas arenae]